MIRSREEVPLPVLAMVTAYAAFQHAGVSMSFSAPAFVTVHEPVVVLATIRNHLREPIEVNLGWNRIEGFEMVVRRLDGNVQRPKITPSDVGRSGRLSLPPGQDVPLPLLLNEWLRFDRPGRYEVEIRLSGPIRAKGGSLVSAPLPDVVTIQVGDRNETLLRQTYQRWADDFLNAVGSVERYNAGRVLRSFSDPVAVPILRNVLNATEAGDPIIVEVLGRIGTPEAQRVLQDLARSEREERAALARNAFLRPKMP